MELDAQARRREQAAVLRKALGPCVEGREDSLESLAGKGNAG